MKHWHCHDCHHEWDGGDPHCDWCGGQGFVLEEETQFARFMKAWAEGWRPKGWPDFSAPNDDKPVDIAK